MICGWNLDFTKGWEVAPHKAALPNSSALQGFWVRGCQGLGGYLGEQFLHQTDLLSNRTLQTCKYTLFSFRISHRDLFLGWKLSSGLRMMLGKQCLHRSALLNYSAFCTHGVLVLNCWPHHGLEGMGKSASVQIVQTLLNIGALWTCRAFLLSCWFH